MKSLSALLVLCTVMPATHGVWTLIDDFQQWEPAQIFTEASDIGWHAAGEPETDEYWILSDPFDAANLALFVYGGRYTDTFFMKELPGGGIQPGETGTIFFQCLFNGQEDNWHVGTSDIPLQLDPVSGQQTAPGAWGDFNALVSLTEARTLEFHDGGNTVPTVSEVPFQMDKWYLFGLIVENTWDSSTSPPTSTGGYSLYVQGPGIVDGVSPMLMAVGSIPPKDSAFFKRSPSDADGNPRAIRWVLFATDTRYQQGCPSCGSVFLLDNLYFSPGRKLDWLDPPEWWWGYYFVNSRRDVDTGDWMGWLNTWSTPFIWSYSLESWLYVNYIGEDDPGAWVYVYK